MECLYFDRSKSLLSHLSDHPRPEVTSGDDVLLRVSHSGVCGTDLHIMKGEFPSLPQLILGHEFSGVVEAVGVDVASHLAVGSRVVVDPNTSCDCCSFCYNSQPNYCPWPVAGKQVGLQRDGGWAQYCVVPAKQVHHVANAVTLAQAALIEPVSCILRGWDRLGPVAEGGRVLVCGAGVIGVLWCCLLHHKGVRGITVSEPSEGRRQAVEKLGLGITALHPREVGGAGESFDVSIDCSGHPAALEMSLQVLGKGGTLLLFGCAPQDATATISPFLIYEKELRIIGSLINPFTFERAAALVADMSTTYLSDLARLGVETFTLNQHQAALDALRAGSITKAMFTMEEK